MRKLIYATNMSLDGYIEDSTGAFDWVDPGEVFGFVTELLRTVGTHLYGRRLYETMAFWSRPLDDYPSEQRAFARIWQESAKIVFSRTLTGVITGNTHIEHDFDPKAIAKLKLESELDLIIGGAELAAEALEADLVDECHLFINPVIVGGGKPAFRVAAQRDLELVETNRLSNGVIHVHYRVRSAQTDD